MMHSSKKVTCWQSGLRSRVVKQSHAFSDTVPDNFERDMGYNEKEFFRVLPAALGEYQFSRKGDLININHPDNQHQLQLKLCALPDRQLGAFRIERIGVQFTFSNMDEKQRLAFMRRFDRRFQRGGG